RRPHNLFHAPNVKDPGYIRRKHAGKSWVRGKLGVLLDDGSFTEMGQSRGSPSTTRILRRSSTPTIGFRKAQGRRVFATVDDFNLRGRHADYGVSSPSSL
ncbi:hypothetical protein FIBSPDRAFT_747011, partial [Athelia psychrophila]